MELKIPSKIKFSKGDKDKGLFLPSKLTEDLAYICGVLIGDGHLGFRKEKKDYFIKCVGHPDDEKGLYDDIIAPAFKRVFGIEIKPKLYDNKTTYGFQIYSKSLLTFFSEFVGLPIGKKSDIIRIPDIIKKSDRMTRAFVRGYADTDFCLTLKKRYRDKPYYPVILGVSKSKEMMKEVANYLEINGFNVSRDFDRKYYDHRVNKQTITHRLQLYGHSQLILWMKEIGFSSPKHIKKYDKWNNIRKTHSWPRIRKMEG